MQTTLEEAIALCDAMMEEIARTSGEAFREQAKAFILDYLRRHGEQPGETLTDKCKEAGIVPVNGDKAFGAVYYALSRRGLIHKTGTCLRRKGHATSGGNVWGLVERGEP